MLLCQPAIPFPLMLRVLTVIIIITFIFKKRNMLNFSKDCIYNNSIRLCLFHASVIKLARLYVRNKKRFYKEHIKDHHTKSFIFDSFNPKVIDFLKLFLKTSLVSFR